MPFSELDKKILSLKNKYENGGDISLNIDELLKISKSFLQLEKPSHFKPFIENHFLSLLQKYKIDSGCIAEIGGHKNSFLHRFVKFDTKFISLFPFKDERYIVGDISNCPHIESNTFDAVISVSVLEHVKDIRGAANEISRILKPGGVTFHVVPFSYFFHGAPVDYWRVTTSAMEDMFPLLDTEECFFYSKNRRRNNIGSNTNPVDGDGGAQFQVDALGGWRENWFTVYTGIKPENGLKRFKEKLQNQAAVDLVKKFSEDGLDINASVHLTENILKHIDFDLTSKFIILDMPNKNASTLNFHNIWNLWVNRSKKTYSPSVQRHNLFEVIKHKHFYKAYTNLLK
ncbi:class I SAM-dependent methyltransferase [Polynucleobacter sp.]|jgi:SAM-dependent methyltransferase|uniref:class I SAM-dependent methyltransferase n=1 Tax=Polynucleobacter sp. TaxID=2029855 RepID=UPI002737616C|nr:class I SAM-dependent methyltransferase [Polynucleobacter sp.]MDP3122554.1 class I SAM-dependent methyltransferase [Polynucleobacter sp.]